MSCDAYQPSRLSRCGEARHASPAWIGTRHRKTTPGAKRHLAMLERLGKDAWLRCDGCAHTVMVKPRELRRSSRARHADAAAHDLSADAVHALRSAEGWLSAGAARHATGAQPSCFSSVSMADRRPPKNSPARSRWPQAESTNNIVGNRVNALVR